MTRLAVIAALAAACAGGSGTAADGGGALPADGGAPVPDAASPGRDPFPVGAISFFLATDCPAQWERYGDAEGRAIVPAPTADGVGVAVGAPLARNEHRGHAHDVAVSFALASTSFAGIAGGGNGGVATATTVTGAVAAADESAAVPYVQLLACRKTTPSGTGRAPPGLMAFFADPACPAGWSPPAGVDGRVLVGLPAGATAGATFGGPPLASGEQRTHIHDATATLDTAAHGIALASGCCAGGYAADGSYAATTSTAPAAADLPYLQLQACVKD